MSTAKREEGNNEFFAAFLEDYFAECDEHLTIVRRNLVALEPLVDQTHIDRSILDELFRSFHSLKGISGMVGLAEAEQLAHQTESYLRALRDNEVTLTSEGMDVLIAGTKMLEQVVAERRAGSSITDIAHLTNRLASLVSTPALVNPTQLKKIADSEPASLNADETARIAAAKHQGVRIWQFEFRPSSVLAERGINVNSLRARLQEAGELIHAAPRLMDEGRIAFEFLVASALDETVFSEWRDDGLTFSAYEHSEIPASALVDAEESRRNLQTAAPPAPSSVVRVDLGRIDDLMRMVGEMVISRSRLDDHLKHLEATLPAPQWRPLQETNLRMERQLQDMREGVMRVRMVPIGDIFERMRFVVRDLAREYQKNVKLEVSGQQTEIDKLLVERMMDPILHLVRNAVSHGLESPAERRSLGKPPDGRLELRAATFGEMVVIEIEDDGRGIDAEDVVKRASAMGLIDPDLRSYPGMLLDLICEPGFSTRQEVDRASGRGIGMSVVKNTVQALGGSVELDTQVGRGTLFTIQLPLTLAIADALIVTVGDQKFAVPQSTVQEVIEVESSSVKVFENNEIISYRGRVLPLLRLARLFKLAESPRSSFQAFVIGTGMSAVGIAVDRVLGQREIVVRAISDPLIRVPGIAGATELGDGQIILIVEAADFRRAAGNTLSGRQPMGEV
ncbi:MAG: chemotaxis protein CheA [Blastocatellia bacterium]